MRQVLSLILIIPFVANAQLKLANIFSDNMVLQTGKPIRIWGKAEPGKQVEIFFEETKKQAIVKSDSTWMISFEPRTINSKPQTITITSGNEKRRLQNILIGDVWLCFGQSNMEWPMKQEMHFKEEVTKSNFPILRFYNPTYAGKDIYEKQFSDSISARLSAENFFEGKWQSSDSNSFKNMSAVAFYFGKEIIRKIDVPIGLINLGVGGAPIETFIRREAMQPHPQFSNKVRGEWLTNNTLPVWIRERGLQNIGNKKNVFKDQLGPNHAFKPGFVFESAIAPITSMPVKGIVFYQGESNAQEIERVKEYGALLNLMVDDYRKQWKQSSMPFYFVQLSSIDTINYNGHLWPQFRDEQRKAMRIISNSGMAVSTDVGAKNDVHPRNKKVVGERLARWALNETYKKEIVPSGPLPLDAEYEKGRVIIVFQYAMGLTASDKKPLRGFSFDGKSDVDAIIHNETVIIAAKEKPQFVYYAWKPFTDANLVNGEKLPASTFKLQVD